MRSNLFALFCITLFILSVPQTFAQSEVESNPTDDQITPETTTEDQVSEVPVTPVEQQETAKQTEVPVEQSKQEEPAEASDDEIALIEPEVVTTTPETNSDEPVAVPEDSQAIVSDKPQEEQEVPATTGDNQQGAAEEVEAEESDDEVVETSEDTGAVVAGNEGQGETAETPAAAATTDASEGAEATNTDATAPVVTPSGEETQQEAAAPAAEESDKTAPVAGEGEEAEEEDEEGISVFEMIGKVLMGLSIAALVVLVGCVYHYRYQMKKYKIAPFTPPSFLPECLFPRSSGRLSGPLVSAYTELQVGNYKAAPRYAEI